MKADLHLHTNYSDGVESPAGVVARAAALGFGVVAVTDHDTVGGVQEAMEAGRRLGIRVVPGVEITSQSHQQELHLLAYFPPRNHEGKGWRHPDLIRQLERDASRRMERAKQIVGRLNKLGVPLTMEEVCRHASGAPTPLANTVGRPHIASALLAAGHVSSMEEAFIKYLKKGCLAWVDKERAEAGEIIALIHRAAGIVALAHPGLMRPAAIPSHLCEEGIDGIEVYHSRHNHAQSRRFRGWTREKGLLVVGGSDCHGMLKGEPLMGGVQLAGEDLHRFLERLDAL